MNVNLSLQIPYSRLETLKKWGVKLTSLKSVLVLSLVSAVGATYYSFIHNYIIAYGDAESHLNIAKRVVQSLTPGLAQLGGIWLPLPHLLMIPFVLSDHLWRTGFAGSIVSGIAFIVSTVYLFKLIKLTTGNQVAAFVGSLVFISNPNLLYLQSTPMTELTLIVFFILSSYYFILYMQENTKLMYLLLSAFFGFCAALSRYDGWALVLAEAGILVLYYFPFKKIPKKFSEIKESWDKKTYQKMEGLVMIFITMAFVAIVAWLLWGYLILGDPLYFTHSQFSAKSQQSSWLARGELPAYHNVYQSLLYYTVTAMSNGGVIIFGMAIVAFMLYLFDRKQKHRFLISLVLLVPYVFNVATLWLGQSVIFIPHITPISFEWRLFNVRYGVMMVPMFAFLVGYLISRVRIGTKWFIGGLLVLQLGLYFVGYSTVITLQDGVAGLSSESAKLPDAQFWFAAHYDKGLVLEDDFARTMSIVRTPVPMQDIIYVGNKPYWDESLKEPEKYATWIIMQQDDAIWRNIYDDPVVQGRLYAHFAKVYTSPQILIFKRNDSAT
jgi:hypothetical protein